MRELGTFTKKGLTLIPRDGYARHIMSKIKEDGAVLVEVWQPRNLKQHRRYFAMLQNVVEASDQWASIEELSFDLALALKRGTFITDMQGSIHFRPDSRAVASMTKDDFERLHRDSIQLLSQWLGCDPEMLREENP